MQSRLKKVLGTAVMIAATAGAVAFLLRPLYGKTDRQAQGACKVVNQETDRAQRLVPKIADEMQLTPAEREQVLAIMVERAGVIDEASSQARAAKGLVLQLDDAGRPIPPPHLAQQKASHQKLMALLGPERGKHFLQRFAQEETAEHGMEAPDRASASAPPSGGRPLSAGDWSQPPSKAPASAQSR
jgi:hypothetical protein